MSMMRFIPAGCVITALIVMCVVASLAMLSGNIAESAYSRSPAPLSITLTQPQWRVAAAQSDATTAFQEEAAGFSAFYRVPAPTETDTSSKPAPRLNVRAITGTLLSPTTSGDTVRTGAGSIVALGDNYGIVSIPMFRATGVSHVHVPSTSVNVYYDDRGWIVAYLPVGEPAALIWRHDASYADAPLTVSQGLEENLLILAINEALTASDPSLAPVTHESAGYYDWENPDCNAFTVFSDSTNGEITSDSPTGEVPGGVVFVVPSTIKTVLSSAAVLITVQLEGGGEVSASVLIDGELATSAHQNDGAIASSHFVLKRSGGIATRHRMSVDATPGKSAVGVVVLLYQKPTP